MVCEPASRKNRFLIEGDLADVVALYNAGAKAPHVALNLRGEFVMTDDRANVCLVGRNPHDVALAIRSVFAPYNLPSSNTPAIHSSSILTTSGHGARAFLKSTQVDALSPI